MHLVQHDDAQIGEEAGPARMLGQDAGVQHVRIGEDDACRVADLGALSGRGVAIVGGAGGQRSRRVYALCSAFSLQCVQRADHLMQLGQLILCQRLGGEQVESTRAWVCQQAIEHGQIVAEGLAAGRGCGDCDVLSAQSGLDGCCLMGVERLNPAAAQCSRYPGIQRGGKRRRACGAGRDVLPADYVAHQARIQPQGLQGAFDRHGTIIPAKGCQEKGFVAGSRCSATFRPEVETR